MITRFFHRLSVVGSAVVVAAAMVAGQSVALAAPCSSVSDCLAQQAQLRQQLLVQQQQAQQSQKESKQLGQQVQSLQQSIDSTQQQISSTADQISQVNQNIADKLKAIADTEAELVTQKSHQDQAIQALYELGGNDPLQVALASKSIGDIFQQSQYVSSIEQQVQAVITQVNKTKATLEQEKQDLNDQQQKLIQLQARQESQKNSLTSQQQQTQDQQANASADAQLYAQQASQTTDQIAQVQQKLRVLTATARWGSDIVSDAPAGWSYVQLDYSQTLGDSRYTIHDYGCLVTSLAMVATYYGHAITPPAIASHSSWFTNGDAYVSSIADGIGITVSGGRVNWDTVDSQLASGHPVIVSIYLPQVGAINRDGSSHFIVISGKSGNHYLMQDPLGPGRGYSLGQVRSMLTTQSQ